MRTEVLLENRNRCFILEDTSQTFMEQYVLSILAIGHLHDGVILLLRPESFSFFLSNLNLVIPAQPRSQGSLLPALRSEREAPNFHKKAKPSRILDVVVK